MIMIAFTVSSDNVANRSKMSKALLMITCKPIVYVKTVLF